MIRPIKSFLKGLRSAIPDADEDYQPPAVEEEFPSLELVAADVSAALELQERRADAIDTKAGVLLGAAAILAGLGGGNSSASHLAALSLDGLSGLFSIVVLIPRQFSVPSIDRIARKYPGLSTVQYHTQVIGNRTEMFARMHERNRGKGRWLFAAALTLFGAVVASVITTATS